LRCLVDESKMSLDEWFTSMQKFMLENADNIYKDPKSLYASSRALFVGLGITNENEFVKFFGDVDNRGRWFDIIFNQNFH